METEPNIVVANPTWNLRFDEAKNEADGQQTGNFYIGYGGFSDQCYLIRTDTFRDSIYNYKHPISERYPKYGGELFEKRVDAYMRVNNKQRITSMSDSYIHCNFPQSKIKRMMSRFLMIFNMYIPYILLLLRKKNT